jgi:AraC-like DNA-binding protein
LSTGLDEPPPDFRLLHFTSDEVAPSYAFDMWRDILTRKLMRVAVDSLTDRPFQAEAMLRSQAGLTIALGDIGPNVSHHTRDIVADDNDDLMLMANTHGKFISYSGGSDLELGVGDATVVSCAEIGRYVRPEPGRLLCLRVPRQALAALAPDPEEHIGQLIPASHGPLRLLMSYAGALWNRDSLTMDPQVSRFVVDHLHDLFALTLDARGDGAELAKARGGRAAKLRAVKAAIESHIGPHEFSVEDVATEVGVSTRYVRKLLEAEGVSFSGYVAERRLERARGLLQSPRASGLTIAAIAYDVGFGDLSYFNRAFRRRFACTPSGVRSGSPWA